MQKRLFAAIKIEPENNLFTVYNSLKNIWQEHKINWVSLDNMHLTFHFFGETDEKLISSISAQLADAVSHIPSFEISISKFGIFGSSYKPRVLWLGIDQNKSIDLLAKHIANNLQKTGYTPDRQNFVPHLTIGRIKHINDKPLFQKQLDEVKGKIIQTSVVHHLYLFESILSSQEASYHIIEKFNFSRNI